MFKTTVFKAIYTRFHIYIHIHAHMFKGGDKEAFRTSIDQRAGRRASLDPDMAVSADE